MAARAGLASSALQSDVPVAVEDTYRRGTWSHQSRALAALLPTASPPKLN